MSDWSPQQYLKFSNERTQPSIDLVAKIKVDNPRSIIDIGCGPGNSTKVLHERWPDAKIVGLDNSSKMIEKARKDYPDGKWVLGDASKLETGRSYDIVFSNATLQWIPDHDILIPRLFEIVNPNGVLGVQVPANPQSPLHRALLSVSAKPKWSQFTGGCKRLLNYHGAKYYYRIVSPLTTRIDLWETTYYHVLASHIDLIEWYRGTGMRPFLERLPDDEYRREFEHEILNESRQAYAIQKDGKILYPFRRLFFVAYK